MHAHELKHVVVDAAAVDTAGFEFGRACNQRVHGRPGILNMLSYVRDAAEGLPQEERIFAPAKVTEARFSVPLPFVLHVTERVQSAKRQTQRRRAGECRT